MCDQSMLMILWYAGRIRKQCSTEDGKFVARVRVIDVLCMLL